LRTLDGAAKEQQRRVPPGVDRQLRQSEGSEGDPDDDGDRKPDVIDEQRE
jgi:hypothetical protein